MTHDLPRPSLLSHPGAIGLACVALLLAGCFSLIDEEEALRDSGDPAEPTLDLTLPPSAVGFALDVRAEARGPNAVIVTATYAPDAPPPRLDLPGGARLVAGGPISAGLARWEVRPPLAGSHHYTVTLSDGERLATESVRCCGPARVELQPTLPPPGGPGQGSVLSRGGT